MRLSGGFRIGLAFAVSSGARVTLVLRRGALALGVLTLFLTPASATCDAPLLTLHAEAGWFSAGCNCSFSPEVDGVVETGTERSGLSGGISSGHHLAIANAEYGVLRASASTFPPDPTGDLFSAVRHRTAAGVSWQDTFLITGGNGPGIYKLSVHVQGGLASSSHLPVAAATGATFGISAIPFQGGGGSASTTYDSLSIDETVEYQQTFEYGQPFEIDAFLEVFADGILDVGSAANFSDTAIVTSAVVFDPATGLPATSAVIETASGTDYSNLGSTPLEVAIDIRPETDPNTINLKSKGVIPVAILTTATLDAATVDPTTVLFGPTGTEAAPVHSALEDVNGDGATDMILHFNTQATGLTCGVTDASLTGETVSGQGIAGSDSVDTAGCK
jgi:hypothetical protein